MDLPTLEMAMAAMCDKYSVAKDVAKSLNIPAATLSEYVNGDGSPKEPEMKLLTSHAFLPLHHFFLFKFHEP